MSYHFPTQYSPHRLLNRVTSCGSTLARAAPTKDTSLEFTFSATDDPGVWSVKTERGEEFVRHPDRSTGYILAAALTHGVASPIKEECL